jgi:hypothetical protein
MLTNRENIMLTMAYFAERQKKYEEALKIYDDLLDNGEVDDNQTHIILLHQGYCLSIIGEYEKAKKKFLDIIKNFQNEDVAITAARLLRFLEELEEEVRKVKESDDNPITKSEKLYKLIAFKEALEILDKVVEEEDGISDKVDYLRARCYEETGEKETSVQIYQDIIDDSIEQQEYNSDIAKQANRRILLVSTTEEEGEKIKELSKKNNELISDPDFSELLNTATKLETAYKEEVRRINKVIEEETAEPTPVPEAQSIETFVGDSEDDIETEEEDTDQGFEEFLEDSLKNVEEKIDKLIEEQSITPAPTPPPTRTPTPKRKQPRRTPVPTALVPTPVVDVESPEGPYQKSIFDDQGKLSKVEQYSESGTLLRVKEFNEQGKISKVEQYDETSGEMIGYFMYEFDEEGNPIKIYAYDPEGNKIEED